MPKLNLIMNSAYLNGYINISPVKVPEHPDVQEGKVFNVDWIVDNGELDELVADKILEYYPYDQVNDIISNWVSKLKIGGQLIIGIVDIYELSRLLGARSLTVEQYNHIAHRPTKFPGHKSSSLSTQEIIDKVTKPHGFKLVGHNLTGVDSTMTFERIA